MIQKYVALQSEKHLTKIINTVGIIGRLEKVNN